MHRIVTALLALFWLVQSVPAWSARMPRGSFLVEPAASAWQLARQVSNNAKVAGRYERHYGVSAEQFAVYARAQLGVRSLKSDGSYRVYHIKSSGAIGSAVRRLRKGTRVFVHLATGKPVLLAECGNPMGTDLPGFAPGGAQNTAPVQNDSLTTVQPVPRLDEPVAPAVVSMEPDLLETPLLPIAEVAQLDAWMADPSLLTPDTPVFSRNTVAYFAPASFSPLFAVGAGVLLSGGGGPSGRGGGTPPAVPEPTTLVLWLGAGSALWWMRQRRGRATV